MPSIVILTNKKNSNLENIMLRALEKNMGASLIENFNQINTSDKTVSLLISIDSIPNSDVENTITVFDSSYKGKASNINGISVVAACCDGALKSMAMSDCTGITCGTSPLDTLSIASCEEGKMLISLQRELQTLSGRVIEPCDISVKTEEPVHIYPTLAACAVLLLCDVPFESGYEI